MLEYLLQQRDANWGQQFKNAVMLGPTIDEDNMVEDIGASEAVLHFLTIGWKVFFAIIPPRKIWGGWLAFIVSLIFIGFVTAIVGEFASLLGCVLGIKDSVTAITFVALGTSLPDTFASMTAAKSAETADSAVGNITGSNSVNVFLGLGLPWVIATIYYSSNEKGAYEVPSGPLIFSVVLFVAIALCCFIILGVRRKVSANLNHLLYHLLAFFIVHRRRVGRTKNIEVPFSNHTFCSVGFLHFDVYTPSLWNYTWLLNMHQSSLVYILNVF